MSDLSSVLAASKDLNSHLNKSDLPSVHLSLEQIEAQSRRLVSKHRTGDTDKALSVKYAKAYLSSQDSWIHEDRSQTPVLATRAGHALLDTSFSALLCAHPSHSAAQLRREVSLAASSNLASAAFLRSSQTSTRGRGMRHSGWERQSCSAPPGALVLGIPSRVVASRGGSLQKRLRRLFRMTALAAGRPPSVFLGGHSLPLSRSRSRNKAPQELSQNSPRNMVTPHQLPTAVL
ncbi:hypothetical protein BT96DRAFT_1008847 [Gymnopus androsaceus JB14]|uniref:Uncharacterized protein n=1 Tax=Gymnopus androsaceus JB14 TaxID=1447944 RepID=A0A6A4GDT2_9AGAR|nr:hypothetical protein BT96DRAFT_1008847 [Gymnopus androsaceus JB14]